jgi:hypothetical protein
MRAIPVAATEEFGSLSGKAGTPGRSSVKIRASSIFFISLEEKSPGRLTPGCINSLY